MLTLLWIPLAAGLSMVIPIPEVKQTRTEELMKARNSLYYR
jgi:hypothetical protein